ncbi:unnamed protein product [Spirodela intermedia]|uniref:Uncharacterized protein n=1 Tax=Spirodela intermedia TaxID=51605 RepID=A0A7I8IJI3_SPIIN|nr:unnamed protein product [Spirodela intermedia]CAA6658047.1 unnamed protein product [Spirodela intermedia]
MGCWLACLRFRAKKRSSPVSSAETTPSKNGVITNFVTYALQLYSLLSSALSILKFWFELGALPSHLCCNLRNVTPCAPLPEAAKFLKACGALLGTPAEFICASKKTNVQPHSQNGTLSNSRFSLPDSSCKELQWDEQPVQIPALPASDSQGHVSETKHDIHTPFMHPLCSDPPQLPHATMTYNNNLHSSAPVSVSIPAPAMTKSVRFEPGPDSVSVDTPQNSNHIHPFASKYSPGPTPLKLTDEMETPGTVYPAKLENHRSQYIYPVSKSMLIQTELRRVNEAPHLPGQYGEIVEHPVQNPESTDGDPKLRSSLGLPLPNPVPLMYSPESSGAAPAGEETLTIGSKSTLDHLDYRRSGYIKHAEKNSGSPAPASSSFSDWLTSAKHSEAQVNGEETTGVDRPIVGIVAAHWSSEETTHTSPKLWDGKGIPNSTKKYNEDQRVRWHATPFEERLEKALSEEKLHPQRKLIDGRAIELGEASEERDTATSSTGDKTRVF